MKKGVVFEIGALALVAGVCSVEGFVCSPPAGGARLASLRPGVSRVQPFLPLTDCNQRTASTTTTAMALVPPKLSDEAGGRRSPRKRLLRWAVTGSRSVRNGLGARGFPFLNRAVERDDEEEYEDDDEEAEDYEDDDEGLNKYVGRKK